MSDVPRIMPPFERQEHQFEPSDDQFCDRCGWTEWVHQ